MGVALVGIGPRHRLSHHIRRHSRKRQSSMSLDKQQLKLMMPSAWSQPNQYSLGSMITQCSPSQQAYKDMACIGKSVYGIS